MTKQQKDWIGRFVEMGEAAQYIVDYILDFEIVDQGQSDSEYGAQVRALNSLKEQARQRVRDMKIMAKR